MKKLILSVAAFFARILPTPAKRALYGFKPLAGLIRGTLNKAAPSGLAVVNIAAGELEGMPMLLDMQNEKDFWLGTYEPEMQSALRELIRPGMTVYDVGANIGYVTLMLAKHVGVEGKVYAFEALPDNVDRLRRDVALNGFNDRVIVYAGAVAAEAGEVKFLVHPSGGMGKAAGSAGRTDEHYQREITVPGVSLDEFVYAQGNPPPQAVKMDIEGGEVMALPGMRRVLAEVRPLMLMELHGPESARAAWDALMAANYTICEMKPSYPRVPSLDVLDWKSYLVALP
jgi:FkbM family methyltransferase